MLKGLKTSNFMLFSSGYNISLTGNETWFDPVLEVDTLLFIDPMLVFQNELEDFSESKQRIRDFFQYAFEAVAQAKGKLGVERQNALSILKFKEPEEIKLGYSNYGSKGSGIGPGFARQVFDAMIDFLDMGFEEFGNYISPFSMFVEGIGPDRISDMIANIIKKDLILYTQKICNEQNIPLSTFTINNFEFTKEYGWIRKKVKLPKNPTKPEPIILVPKDFLRTEEILDINDFESYLSHIENDELRQQCTKLIAGDLNRHKLREISKKNPLKIKEALRGYINMKEKEKNLPYDVRNDPNLLYWFIQEIEKIKKNLPTIETENADFESLKKFVESVIEQFKRCVETREGYRLLFNDNDIPKEEKASQILFWGIADTMCRNNGKIVLSPESQTGRGPVDFNFSKDYFDKIHVEFKLAKSTKIYQGLEKQFLTYMKSDEVKLGYYVPIKLLGGDNVRVIRLNDRYKKLPEEDKKKIIIKVIDAYPGDKISASKLK